jgi:Flp pilus assembly protein TadD
VLGIDPSYSDARYNLAIALGELGDESGAMAEYERVLQFDPGHAAASNNWASLLERRGQFSDAVRILSQALERSPDHPILLQHLSWVLATSPDGESRNGNQAVGLAQRLTQIAGEADPRVLDVLAAAYAEAGDFAQAAQAAMQAVKLAEDLGQPALAEPIRARMELYRSRQAFRVAPP